MTFSAGSRKSTSVRFKFLEVMFCNIHKDTPGNTSHQRPPGRLGLRGHKRDRTEFAAPQLSVALLPVRGNDLNSPRKEGLL